MHRLTCKLGGWGLCMSLCKYMYMYLFKWCPFSPQSYFLSKSWHLGLPHGPDQNCQPHQVEPGRQRIWFLHVDTLHCKYSYFTFFECFFMTLSFNCTVESFKLTILLSRFKNWLLMSPNCVSSHPQRRVSCVVTDLSRSPCICSIKKIKVVWNCKNNTNLVSIRYVTKCMLLRMISLIPKWWVGIDKQGDTPGLKGKVKVGVCGSLHRNRLQRYGKVLTCTCMYVHLLLTVFHMRVLALFLHQRKIECYMYPTASSKLESSQVELFCSQRQASYQSRKIEAMRKVYSTNSLLCALKLTAALFLLGLFRVFTGLAVWIGTSVDGLSCPALSCSSRFLSNSISNDSMAFLVPRK